MQDHQATRATGKALMRDFAPQMGRRYANGRNFDHRPGALVLSLGAVTAVATRQVLMPASNRATDMGDTTRFRYLHGLSVVVTLAHIALAGFVLAGFMLARFLAAGAA